MKLRTGIRKCSVSTYPREVLMTPSRTMFWQIDNAWLLYLLAVFATRAFLAGVVLHSKVWRNSAQKGRKLYSKRAVGRTLVEIVTGQRILRGNLAAGIAHLLIFWGFVILLVGTSLLAVHDHIYPFLTGASYLLFEIAMEVGGLFLLAGIIWALVRRYIQRVPRLERTLEDAVVPLWLLVLACSGFFLEAVRLAAQRPTWGEWSLVGWLIAHFIPQATAGSIYPAIWWGHALLSLLFIATIPYTKLFHLVGAPAASYLHYCPPKEVEGELSLMEAGVQWDLAEAASLDACMRCGRCVQACPSAGAGEPLLPRGFIQAARHSLWQEHSPAADLRKLYTVPAPADGTSWYCTTCGACMEVCPVHASPFRAIGRKRAQLVEQGTGVPDLMNQTLEKLFNYENPWVANKRERTLWAKDLEIPVLKPGANEDRLCYFVGCTTAIDPRTQAIARSFSAVLKHAQASFGTLGDKEPCCGDIARVVGELGLFQEKVENCSALLEKYEVKEIVTSSPHCYHTFANKYPGGLFRVRHYSVVLKELLDNGKLKLKIPVNSTVTYHDPCYLGRHNHIFDEPREVIRSIPGIRFTEMRLHGPDSLCCGGGGGRMWQGPELRGEARMSEIRIKQARETGADILVTACPLCLIMLEDSLKTCGLEGDMRVMDLNELVLKSIG
ncbi:MAG: heterodisulfide reductase-related iron-sulfur binding cluster [Syntrophobacteraceae bacterium]|nr:heterodisulfide reductase-related iron-sulfur binding cluster [Syntrophobacteraceae bacterium]